MKAFDEPRRALTRQAGLILLFDGEVDPASRDHDEHSPADILTSGLEPYSRLPDPALRNQWLISPTLSASGSS